MALADTLRERVSRRGRTAQVDCGELGAVTVEALSPRECAALGMADGGRALLYAACRELQAAGETLRRERRLFTPGEVTQFVSDGEALAAARTILELSGVSWDGADSGENRLVSVQESGKDFSEIRLGSVQEPDSSGPELLTQGENRLGDVQKPGNQFSEIRPGIVQFPEGAPADGQVSREFFERAAPPQVTPSMGAGSNFEPQNLALSGKNGDFMSPLKLSGARAGARETGAEASEDSHEIESEFPERVHEIESEVPPKAAGALHETTSEFPDATHETESEFREGLHEIRSEFPGNGRQMTHETESEFREGLHETTSEFDENRREPPHEITSELAERVAERLLEGLRRAAAVR